MNIYVINTSEISFLENGSKWKTDNELSEFVIYFERQWINSKFGNWQLFKTPVGFAMTNSPIESYNNTIKKFLY
jgi:Rps23 Pro-64 3,4-dihydroxylase Tpa1-like proline 4-hydroxylase